MCPSVFRRCAAPSGPAASAPPTVRQGPLRGTAGAAATAAAGVACMGPECDPLGPGLVDAVRAPCAAAGDARERIKTRRKPERLARRCAARQTLVGLAPDWSHGGLELPGALGLS